MCVCLRKETHVCVYVNVHPHVWVPVCRRGRVVLYVSVEVCVRITVLVHTVSRINITAAIHSRLIHLYSLL